jgi:hypothetical protein
LNLNLKLIYDRRSVGQSVVVSGPHLEHTTRFYYCRTLAVFVLRAAIPDERTGLQFTRTIFCHSLVQVPQNSWPHLTVSFETICYCLIRDSHNLEGQARVFISPTDRVAQLYPPYTGFPFCRLLRLAGLRWIYFNPPPHGSTTDSSYISTDGQSASWSWCRAPTDFDFRMFDNFFLCSSSRAPPLTRGRVCNLQCKHSLVRIAQNP